MTLKNKAFITSALDQSIQNYVAFEISFDATAYNDSLYKILGIAPPDSITKAVIKRRAEFLAGRYAVLRCFEKLNITSKSHDIFTFDGALDLQIGIYRSPLWPKGFIGSISHTNARAYALVASTDNYHAVGIDIENWLPYSSYEQIGSLILSGNEDSLIRSNASENCNTSIEHFFTLIFSAKESLFKALYPLIGHYFDFKDAETTEFDNRQKFLRIKLLKSLGTSPWLEKYAEHKVQFLLRDNIVYTCVLVKK